MTRSDHNRDTSMLLLDEAVKHGVPVAGRESLEYLRPIFKETGMAIET